MALITIAVTGLLVVGTTAQGTSAAPLVTEQESVAAAPAAPVITSPDSGTTTSNRPAITVARSSQNSVTVSEGSAVLCTIPAGASSCTPTNALAAGAHNITATQVSAAGDASAASAAVPFIVVEPAALILEHFGAATAVPGQLIPYFVVLTNTGPGIAVSPTVALGFGALNATACTIDGVAASCESFGSLSPADLAPGAKLTLGATLSIPVGTPVSTAFPVSSSANASGESPVRVSASVTAVAPSAPTITTPAEGAETVLTSPLTEGAGALAGATITVTSQLGPYCTTSVPANGSWSCRPASGLPLGAHRLLATQTVDGVTSEPSAPRSFVVVQTPAAVPEPAPTPSATTPPPPSDPAPTAALPVDIRFSTTQITQGSSEEMRGTLGPNSAAAAVTITFSGSVSAGMSYREVTVTPGGLCELSQLRFTCTVALEPGASATVSIRLHADNDTAPGTARQELSIDSSLAEQSNSFTSTIDVASAGAGAANPSFKLALTSPLPWISLVALLLIAIVVAVVERRRFATRG